ncbi:hypothetical protein D9M72_422600 [compost metagenome]
MAAQIDRGSDTPERQTRPRSEEDAGNPKRRAHTPPDQCAHEMVVGGPVKSGSEHPRTSAQLDQEVARSKEPTEITKR